MFCSSRGKTVSLELAKLPCWAFQSEKLFIHTSILRFESLEDYS